MDISLSKFCDDPDTWLTPLAEAMSQFEIDSAPRMKMFLAQTAFESNGFSVLVENLDYSAQRLLEVFPRKFSAAEALSYAGYPERIANHVYANLNGNGGEVSGDGWRFRGRGLIQLTARGNYERCGRALTVDLLSAPDLLTAPEWAAKSAAWFWQVNGCNELADADDYAAVTKRINGGLTGYEGRITWLHKVEGAMT